MRKPATKKQYAMMRTAGWKSIDIQQLSPEEAEYVCDQLRKGNQCQPVDVLLLREKYFGKGR